MGMLYLYSNVGNILTGSAIIIIIIITLYKYLYVEPKSKFSKGSDC